MVIRNLHCCWGTLPGGLAMAGHPEDENFDHGHAGVRSLEKDVAVCCHIVEVIWKNYIYPKAFFVANVFAINHSSRILSGHVHWPTAMQIQVMARTSFSSTTSNSRLSNQSLLLVIPYDQPLANHSSILWVLLSVNQHLTSIIAWLQSLSTP